MLDSRPTSDFISHTPDPANSSDSSIGSNEPDLQPLTPSQVPTPTLLVTKLPTLLFSEVQDLHPLFYPFGHIKKLEVVERFPTGNTSIVVEYSSANSATEAKEALQGQYYAGSQIDAQYVRAKAPLVDHAQAPDSTDYKAKTLNAFARPFSMKAPSLFVSSGGSHHDSINMQQPYPQYLLSDSQGPFSNALPPSLLCAYPRDRSRSSSIGSGYVLGVIPS